MIQLGNLGIGQNCREARCRLHILGDLDQMGIAVTSRHLYQTKPVAGREQPHGLAIDGDRRAGVETFRQVMIVQIDSHRG